MPGLVGIVSLNDDKIDADLMSEMRDAIRHRDWYKMDDYVNASATVAVSRVHLGIIDQGKQPYSGRGGRVKILFHGEIYNDEAANGAPLEFIYRLYEREGAKFASFLNGSFVVVIVDEDRDVVLLANDRLAAKPLFYFSDGQAVYFGPEMKSLFLVPSLERRLNLSAVADFLANGHFTREHTLVEDLEAVDGATVLEIGLGRVVRHKYWEYGFQYGKDRGPKYYQQELAGLLRQAVRRRLRTDNTYGVLLSGGYDSRGILGCYLEERGDQELYTISWGRAEDIPNSDCAIANRLARKLGANHRFYELTAEEVFDNFRDFVLLGEGLIWYPESYDVFHRIREQQGVDVLLRGDECFGWQGLMVYDRDTMLRSLMLSRLQNVTGYRRVLKPHYYRLFCEFDADTVRHILSRCETDDLHDCKDFLYLDMRLKHMINPLNYVKNYALESLTPWLDYDIVDFVSTLPVKYRLDKRLYRRTIVGMFPELFEEVARSRNDIDWPASFKGFPKLQRFIYRELVEGQNAFSEFIDTARLKSELDAYFSAPSVQERAKAKMRRPRKASALKLREVSPAVFNLLYRSAYYARRWMGRPEETLPFDRVIIRLLILKVWGDVFLNYPVAGHRSG